MGKEKKKRRGMRLKFQAGALTKKLTLELRCEGDKGLDHIRIWGKEYSWKGEWQVQKPCGKTRE